MPLIAYIPGYEGRLAPLYINPTDREYKFLLHHEYSVSTDRVIEIKGMIIKGIVYMWPGNGLNHTHVVTNWSRWPGNVHPDYLRTYPWFAIWYNDKDYDNEPVIYVYHPTNDVDRAVRDLHRIQRNPYMRRLMAAENIGAWCHLGTTSE